MKIQYTEKERRFGLIKSDFNLLTQWKNYVVYSCEAHTFEFAVFLVLSQRNEILY